jgi:tRNA:m4X modification enzyme
MKKEKEETKAVEKDPEEVPRCHAYLPKKKRFCRQIRCPTSLMYCGNHAHLFSTTSKSEDQESSTRKRKRVPCPLDPSHDIFEDMVEKHLKICPVTRQQKDLQEKPFYAHDMNAGGYGELKITSSPTIERLEWAKQVALCVIAVHQKVFGDNQRSPAIDLDPTQISHKEILEAIPTQDYSQNEINAGLIDAIQEFRIRSGGARHVPQIASLVGHLRSIDVLPSSTTDQDCHSKKSSRSRKIEPATTIFLEMGAGRGMFGLTAAGVANTTSTNDTVHQQTNGGIHLAMIERTGSRGKADTVLRTAPDNAQSTYMNLKDIGFSRIECDLSHVNMSVIVKELKGRKVAIAKHLCGAGTDLALKSLASI